MEGIGDKIFILGLVLFLAIGAFYAGKAKQNDLTANVSSSTKPESEEILDNDYLNNLVPKKQADQIVGQVVIGHEVREITDCENKTTYWILGDSPALDRIKYEYGLKMADSRIPYQSVVMTLEGKVSTDPIGGYGASYQQGFYATKIIEVTDKEKCEISK